MARPRKIKKPKYVKARIEEEKFLILKERFGNISEAIRQAIDLLLQQYNIQTQQIPNQAMTMGRGFSSGNFTHVVDKPTTTSITDNNNGNGMETEFLSNLETYNIAESLEWSRRQLVKAYQKAYKIYSTVEQITNSNNQLDITPYKRKLSEALNQCNRFLSLCRKYSIELINRKYKIPEETVSHIEQIYKLFLELKRASIKNDWVVDDILYKSWSGKMRGM